MTLLLLVGPTGALFVTKSPTVIGRSDTADICLQDDFASRSHALLQWTGVQWHIQDLGSSNGTFLNGSMVDPRKPLQDNDEIRIGHTVLRVQTQSDPNDSGQAQDGSFVDYYAVLGVAPESTPQAISDRVRDLIKVWHPDVCKDPRAHEMAVLILEAKRVLLDPHLRAEFDNVRSDHLSGPASGARTDATQTWRNVHQQTARRDAEVELLIGLAAILAALALLTVELVDKGVNYAWQGTEQFHGRSGPSARELFWCGLGGWACVICLVVPGVSIITFWCFRWAFFPGPSYKFIGMGNVLKGMVYSAAIVLGSLLFISLVLSIMSGR